jgi:transposase
MAKPWLEDKLWTLIEPLLPPAKPRRGRWPGRKPLAPRQVLTGILFVLTSGLPWDMLPQELGCGSGMTCWRYLRAWQKAGVWPRLHAVLSARLREADQLDWSRAAVDSSSVRRFRAAQTGPHPTDRRQLGRKHHRMPDAQGIPLAVRLTAANTHDITQLMPLVDAVPPVRGKPGCPRRRPKSLYGDRAYDSAPHRRALRERGIAPQLAKRRALLLIWSKPLAEENDRAHAWTGCDEDITTTHHVGTVKV